MAGKSSKGRSKGKSAAKSAHNDVKVDSETVVSERVAKEADTVLKTMENAGSSHNSDSVSEANDQSEKASPEIDAAVAISDNGTPEDPNKSDKHGNGELRLYPIIVKGPSGEKLELQINPTDSVMDVRQFLLDAAETCFYTCYDLIMVSKDGTRHQLADYLEIGDVCDVTTGGCSLEMHTALYDDRSIRFHVRRIRDLISTVNFHTSLSTRLAMEYEANHHARGAEQKQAASELDGLGFMEDTENLLQNLVVTPSSQEVKCIESIAFSSFNPPPGYRRLVGDLIYLDVTTLEGQSYCVTGHTRGFYVNASSGMLFESKLVKASHESTSLVGLLRKISEAFRKGFREVLEKKFSGHPFENVANWLPLNPWLGVHPHPAHKRDASRAEDAIALPYGTDPIGMLRDWNEELQSCREFPRKTLQDRILRDRALYKVSCDFVDAAVKGAQGVIHRCIPPINPTDPERFHMYVHNNIFFSFAVDSDLVQMQQLYDQGAKSESNRISESVEILSSEQKSSATYGPAEKEQGNGLVDEDIAQNAKNSSDNGHDESIKSSSENSESQISENEQATYASANNDLKGTKAYNNADVPGLYTLAMAIVDYRGYRVVAQSIIPGILQGDKSDSLLYGSVDNGKKICWNEKFHEKVLEASKVLHLKEHEVLDDSGNKVKIAAPVECKGIIGSDDRHYLLDLMRTTPRDANFVGPTARYCLLRPELVTSFCQLEQEKRTKKSTDNSAEDLKEEPTAVLLNPNVLTTFKLAGDAKEIAEDEALVKKAGAYLVDTVIQKFVQDLCTLEVSPMDGQTLTEALHAHGINIRYIGKVANMASNLPHIWDLCVVEMVVRAVKHVLKGVLRETQDHDLGGAVSHFFNCFIGRDAPAAANSKIGSHAGEKSRKKSKSAILKKDNISKATGGIAVQDLKNHGKSGQHSLAYLCITAELVWIDIKEYVKFKYQFDLPEGVKERVKKMSTFRNLCQKLGLTIAARKYDFNSDVPFEVSDILDMHAVVKHSAPVCADARDFIEAGKLQLAEGKLNEAYDLFSEAFAVLQQVSGPMHREVANCCRYLAMVLYHAGNMAGAIMQQHKELIINERCLGVDHPDTAHSYGNMALFYHGLNQTELALKHMARTLLLLNVTCGPNHPDVAATFINIAMMYQDIGRMNIALRYLQEALKKNESLLGNEHIQTAVCYHALAIAFNCMGAYKLSVQHEKNTYNILSKHLGVDDARTQDSANWMKTFQAAAQKQKGQANEADVTQMTVDALKGRPDFLQALQASGGSAPSSRTTLSKAAAAAALMGNVLPRRGMDERGARAAAEIRKRAAAKGINVRSSPVTVQTVPQLAEVLNLINACTGSKASSESNQAACQERPNESTSHGENATKDKLVSEEGSVGTSANAQEKAPLGLGAGLVSLDNKKQKQKAKTLNNTSSN